MDLTAYREAQRRLARVAAALVALYPDVDPAVVRNEVRETSKGLRATAKFCDYVPVLTYRLVRERLSERVQLRRAA